MQSRTFVTVSLLALSLSACLQASKVDRGADPAHPRTIEPSLPQPAVTTNPNAVHSGVKNPPVQPAGRLEAELSQNQVKSQPLGAVKDEAYREPAPYSPPPAAAPVEEYKAREQVAGAPAARHDMAKQAFPARGMVSVIPPQEFNTESYRYLAQNDYLRPTEKPLSTFSADVDTASYANVRRFLNGGARPPQDAVRVEELVNYFPYRYPEPKWGEPFGVRLDMAEAPWNPQHRLVRIGIKSKSINWAERKASNLVFLLDVSGSMNSPYKLPLVIESMQMLTEQLNHQDRVTIVVYAGASGLVLPPTPGSHRGLIIDALSRLSAGGSTNGAAGIQLAYQMAREQFIRGGNNRVILATDGDFNVGTTSEGELVRLVQEQAKSGVFLTVLGFGMGNYKDAMLEQIADKGNGNYAYIDSRNEACKVFVDQLGGTLETVAKDVKFQVEFNPALVEAYRLIGYENRVLQDHEFNDDRVDAGDVGAGHTVTALYEIVPVGASVDTPRVDPLKYQQNKPSRRYRWSETLTLKIRYKEPEGDTSRLLTYTLRDEDRPLAMLDEDFRFAAAVAAWGMVLRESPHKGAANHDLVLALAQGALGHDPQGYRAEFLSLVNRSRGL